MHTSFIRSFTFTYPMSSEKDLQHIDSESVCFTILSAEASPFNIANRHEGLDIAELPGIWETPFKKVNSEVRASIADIYLTDPPPPYRKREGIQMSSKLSRIVRSGLISCVYLY